MVGRHTADSVAALNAIHVIVGVILEALGILTGYAIAKGWL